MSANTMSSDTLAALKKLEGRPGLAFYVSYAHVEDVARHLGALHQWGSGSAGAGAGSAPALASCILATLELMLELVYRAEVADSRPGLDRTGLALLVDEVANALLGMARVALAVDSFDDAAVGDGAPPLDDKGSPGVDGDYAAQSVLHRLAAAAELGLLSRGALSALRTIVTLLDDAAVRVLLDRCVGVEQEHKLLQREAETADDVAVAIESLRRSLGMDQAPPFLFGAVYQLLARTIPNQVMANHRGGGNQSPYGPEDLTFQLAHVVLEHFFWYAEHALLPHAGDDSDGHHSTALLVAAPLFDVCTKCMGVLDFMLLADFHPMRVCLHGSSGFFSEAFHRIRARLAQAYRRASSRLTLDKVHISPELAPSEHQFLQRLDRASAAFRVLTFRHYVLAQRTIGCNSMGSAGKSFEQMERAFVSHPDPESNASKFRLHEYTNAKYTGLVGRGVQAVYDEAVPKEEELPHTVGTDTAPSARLLERLGRSFVEADADAFVGLFDLDDCRVEHPPPPGTDGAPFLALCGALLGPLQKLSGAGSGRSQRWQVRTSPRGEPGGSLVSWVTYRHLNSS